MAVTSPTRGGGLGGVEVMSLLSILSEYRVGELLGGVGVMWLL